MVYVVLWCSKSVSVSEPVIAVSSIPSYPNEPAAADSATVRVADKTSVWACAVALNPISAAHASAATAKARRLRRSARDKDCARDGEGTDPGVGWPGSFARSRRQESERLLAGRASREDTLGSGLWALGSGLWALGSGLWALGSGLWALGSGLL